MVRPRTRTRFTVLRLTPETFLLFDGGRKKPWLAISVRLYQKPYRVVREVVRTGTVNGKSNVRDVVIIFESIIVHVRTILAKIKHKTILQSFVSTDINVSLVRKPKIELITFDVYFLCDWVVRSVREIHCSTWTLLVLVRHDDWRVNVNGSRFVRILVKTKI